MLCRSLVLAAILPVAGLAAAGERATPEERALAFLVREVPRWSRAKHCYSCHNNGDAARALYSGLQSGFAVPRAAVEDSTTWLCQPDRWEHNGGEGPFSDKLLARVQFTAALAAARRAGLAKDPGILARAAARLAQDQAPDGSWPVDGENEPGSPVTCGRFLATFLARESLRTADPTGLRQPIARAERWLLDREIKTCTDASVMLMVTQADSSPRTSSLQAQCLELLCKGQSEDGGWGPFLSSPPEVYDTALALIALESAKDRERARSLIRRGRSFLIAQQQADGSWIETTRPPGAESYAQRISTTGWATMALISTRSGSADRRDDAKR
jgi:squalene cyclase